MILPKPSDAIHKIQMYRLLKEILDNAYLSQNLYFKGGTCASMLNYLDRFSFDLDFDLKKGVNKNEARKKLDEIFRKLEFEIKDESKLALQFFLRYESQTGLRNTLKIEASDKYYQNNEYQKVYLSEIDRFAQCQTIETMFSHKLVALQDRFVNQGSIAGRDAYDIHHFFLAGYRYKAVLLEERTGKKSLDYFRELKKFIAFKVTDKVISQDLNTLLPFDKFKTIRNNLKGETLLFVEDEIRRLS